MMTEGQIHDAFRQALWITVEMSLPLLAVALAAGLVIGLMQALTSIQEMTLTFVPKLGAMMAVFWLTMGGMTAALVGFFDEAILPLVAGG
ncbi:MAG: flagellar biosynthetic protein FliQ [Rhodobacterales bacterium]|nr:flagellar biosynthetic protein FliQ [Rhodobacterales bacterium]